MLGLMYFQGHGVAKDYASALIWLRKAAEKGNADAQDVLGAMYDLGLGTGKNPVEAAFWRRKAAEQGASAVPSAPPKAYLRDMIQAAAKEAADDPARRTK
jgi:hypothetical protein